MSKTEKILAELVPRLPEDQQEKLLAQVRAWLAQQPGVQHTVLDLAGCWSREDGDQIKQWIAEQDDTNANDARW